MKRVFVAFAIEDERMRDMVKGHTLHPKNPYEYVDLSVKEAYATDWKEKVRVRIRGCDGVLVLLSRNSLTSSGQKWEVECAKAEMRPVYGIWIYSNDRTVVAGVPGHIWTWDGVGSFIDSL